MSAYGSAPIQIKGIRTLPEYSGTLIPLSASPSECLLVIGTQKSELPAELKQYLCSRFNDVVAEGRTYPTEEELSQSAFEDYYLSNDIFLGFVIPDAAAKAIDQSGSLLTNPPALSGMLGNKTWAESGLAGMYYVKPNYPGRSSHCCNAGFVVFPDQRGKKLGLALAKSYLLVAPRLGYRSSVFNLVYVNNQASVAIWDRLGFTRAGLIPKAGRLKKQDGSGEEYVDAIVFYKEFEETSNDP